MRILVGISGGVDSSVAALLLREAGHEVEGIMFNQVEEPEYSCEGNVCCGENAVRRAREVSRQLNIHLHVADLRKEFLEKVMSPTQAALDVGHQPAPCNMCNREVRGPKLAQYAAVLECDAFATGHYFKNDRGVVSRAIDLAKDQSYMVSRVARQHLRNWLTPLGEMTKTEVRAHAARLGLVTASTPDSMNLCFAHKLKHKTRDVVEEYVYPDNPARQSRKLGVTSQQVAVGQRKGMSGYTALRVLPDSVIVHPGKVDCSKTRFELNNFNWILDPAARNLSAMTSSHGKLIPCAVTDDSVELSQPSLSSAGQVVAFYEGDTLIGSAIVT